MRILGRLIIGLVLVIVLLAGIGMLLPRTVTVTRSTEIAAPPEAIFEFVNSLQKAEEWSPWLGIDPDVQTTYSGPEAGVGNRLDWASDHPNVGNGSQEIIASTAPASVRTALDFGDMGGGEAWFDISGSGESSDVLWGLEADMGAGPIGRWMGLMMDDWVGGDYEKGLANLKALVEGS